MKCFKCQTELPEGSRFCNACGVEQVAPNEDAHAEASASEEAALTEAPKKKRSRKLPILILSAVILLLTVGVVLFFVFSQPKPHNYMLYIKDGDLYYSAVSEIAPLRVTDGLEEIDALAAYGTILTQDGCYLFYLDACRSAESGQALYRRDLTDPESKGECIAFDVLEYEVNAAGDRVTYLCSEQDAAVLYQHHAENENRIATDVARYVVSADGLSILYTDQAGTLYLQKNGARTERIDDAVSEVVYADESLAQIYYLKDGALYGSNGTRGKWIASDVLDVMVSSAGSLYYCKENKAVTISAKDLMDLESAVSYLADGGGAVLSEEAFWKQMDAQVQERLGKVKILYHRDTDGNVTKVCENYLSARLWRAEAEMLVYDTYDPTSVQKMDLTVDAADWSASLFRTLSSVQKSAIAFGDHAVSLGVSGASRFFADDACRYLCYLTYDAEALDADLTEGTLYRVEIVGRDVKASEKIATDVYEKGVTVAGDGKCFYFKHAMRDGKDLSADLYCDGRRICRGISTSDITYEPTTDRLLFLSDWSSADQLGTLQYYHDGEVVTIADEAHGYEYTPAGEILYLTNWNGKRGRGELYLYRDDRSEPIDDAVSAILPVD